MLECIDIYYLYPQPQTCFPPAHNSAKNVAKKCMTILTGIRLNFTATETGGATHGDSRRRTAVFAAYEQWMSATKAAHGVDEEKVLFVKIEFSKVSLLFSSPLPHLHSHPRPHKIHFSNQKTDFSMRNTTFQNYSHSRRTKPFFDRYNQHNSLEYLCAGPVTVFSPTPGPCVILKNTMQSDMFV